ncbi:hypothetical protein CFC21_104771 [Triticum aestivum]|uniref:Uncharacterized protein n=2 Tax=Triticum aestivum TaxID=4565 RepID=A0A9R1MAJ6_WHEAT|nr:hypothetical protein CFC21_104771 [Triticum aestivum]
MASRGEVKRRNKDSELDCRALKLSTCKIKKVGIGGPLINFGGNLVGMNFYDGHEETPFLPRSKVVDVLKKKIGLALSSERGLNQPEEIQGGWKENRWPVPTPYWYHGVLEVDRWILPDVHGMNLQ